MYRSILSPSFSVPDAVLKSFCRDMPNCKVRTLEVEVFFCALHEHKGFIERINDVESYHKNLNMENK